MTYTETDILRNQVARLRMALKIAINTVECASLDKDGTELPWYVGAKAALNETGGMEHFVRVRDIEAK